MKNTKIVAVLSTTVLPLDGVYRVERLREIPNIQGVPHYIGHPATQAIVEGLGAVKASSNLFSGLNPGESAIAFSIKQGRSTRAQVGYTNPHQDVSLDDLDIRLITRIDGQARCPYCGADTLDGWFCPECGAE